MTNISYFKGGKPRIWWVKNCDETLGLGLGLGLAKK